MSEIRASSLSELVIGCKNAIVQVGNFLATGHAASQDYVRQTLGAASASGLNEQQQAVCAQLRGCVIRPQGVKQIQQQVQAVLHATTTTELEQSHRQLTASVLQEQRSIVQDLAPQIAKATEAAGFTNVQLLPRPDRVLIIGENERGQAIQHEVLAVPNQPLTLKSETVGFHDQSCGDALDRFSQELRQRGITFEQANKATKLRRRRPVRQKVQR